MQENAPGPRRSSQRQGLDSSGGVMFHWSWLLIGCLLACLASFRWAMNNFFFQPAGDVPGMKAIRYSSASFAVLHLVAILVAPAVPPAQVLVAGGLYLLALGL